MLNYSLLQIRKLLYGILLEFEEKNHLVSNTHIFKKIFIKYVTI